jgi:hypothetical protein
VGRLFLFEEHPVGMREEAAETAALQKLFQAFDQVQICQHSVVAEDAGFGVGGHIDWADVFYAGGVGGH